MVQLPQKGAELKTSLTIGLLLLGLALTPSGDASFTDVRVWHAYATSFTDANGVVAATSFSLHAVPHSFTVTSRITLITVSVAFTTTPASPGTIDDYLGTLTIKEGTTTRAECNGISFSRANIPDTGRIQFTFTSFCHASGANALNPGTTYTYETAITMVTGTNKIVNSGWSIAIEESDTITDATLDPLETKAHSTFEHDQTRDLVNVTNSSLHAHLVLKNQHLNTLESNLTTLIMEFGCSVSNCSFQVEPFSVVEMPGYDSEQVGALILFLAFLVFSYFQRWLFVALASVIGILDTVVVDGIFGFTFTLLLLVMALVLEVLRDMRDARNAEREEKESGEE